MQLLHYFSKSDNKSNHHHTWWFLDCYTRHHDKSSVSNPRSFSFLVFILVSFLITFLKNCWFSPTLYDFCIIVCGIPATVRLQTSLLLPLLVPSVTGAANCTCCGHTNMKYWCWRRAGRSSCVQAECPLPKLLLSCRWIFFSAPCVFLAVSPCWWC